MVDSCLYTITWEKEDRNTKREVENAEEEFGEIEIYVYGARNEVGAASMGYFWGHTVT